MIIGMDTTTRYIDIHAVASRYSIARRTVWRYVRDGVIPPPIYLAGPGSGARWRIDLLDRHDAERDASGSWDTPQARRQPDHGAGI